MNHEKEYMKNLAADPDIKHFGERRIKLVKQKTLRRDPVDFRR